MLGLCIEGCCCDPLSLSITRMYIMDIKNLHPDPVDYQIIRFSNCLQLASCICSCAAVISGNDACNDVAQCLQLAAEIVLRVVMGCISAQISMEIQHSKVPHIGDTEVPVVGGSPYQSTCDAHFDPQAPEARSIDGRGE